MKHRFLPVAAALLSAVMLLSLSSCGRGSSGKLPGGSPSPTPAQSPDNQVSVSPSAPGPDNTPFAYSEAAQISIEDLYTGRRHELFAAAYLGYREKGDTTDFVEWLHNSYPLMPAFWPFLTEIPQEDIIGDYGELYCVVPMDESVTFTVKGVEWETLGNGTQPHYSEPLYHAEVGRPFLLYVTHGRWRDETSLTVEYVQQDGFVGTWFPTYDPETGRLEIRKDSDGRGTVLDFALRHDIGWNMPMDVPIGDMEWLPPTDLGLGNTAWYSENGWVLEFSYDESAEAGSGCMVLYQPVEGEDGTILTPYYDGTWWMEDDSLCLGVYEGNCPFPLLISPSGELLVIMQADDGSVLPFFEKGQTTAGLTLRQD